MDIKKVILNKYFPILAFLIIWELSSRIGIINPLFIPPLSKVLIETWELFRYGNLANHLTISLVRVIEGFTVAVLIAIPTGLILGGWFQKVQLALEPLMEIFAQANPFILFHIIMLFLGIGESTKIVIITWMCIWPIMLNTISGIRNLDRQTLKAARSFGIGPWTLFYKIVLPGAAPEIFTGLRLSAGYAFFMLIAAEMMGASSGLGWLVISNQENYHITRIFSAALIIAFLGMVIDILMGIIEGKIINWKNNDFQNHIIYKKI